ncbi:MAG: transposase family protein [Bdellovibrionales bacterium]|nr:transposase family protein [Bdellovibrionales bacterium]
MINPLEAYGNQVIAFAFAQLQQYLRQLPDKRSNRGKVYPLPLILTYILIVKLAGYDKPSAIACDEHLKLDHYLKSITERLMIPSATELTM